MSSKYLVYPLQDGYIHNWLVAGPKITPIPSLDRGKQEKNTYQFQICQQYHDAQTEDAILDEQPVDQSIIAIAGESLTWNYVRCQEDHYIDVSNFNPTWQHLQTWAYTEIKSHSVLPVNLILTTRGMADIWLNGKHIYHQENYSNDLASTHIGVSLEKENNLLVRFEQVAVRECENVLAVQLVEFPSTEAEEATTIRVPTLAFYPLRQQALEQIFQHAYLEEVVNHRGAHFNLRWAEDLEKEITFAYKIMDSDNLVYVDGIGRTNPAKPVDVGHTFRLLERPYFVTLEAPLKEFFEQNLRYRRKLPIHVLDNTYSSTPYEDLPHRRLEALKEAAKFDHNLFAEIAKMEVERWADVNPNVILDSANQVKLRRNDSDILLVGLLGILYRYQDNPSFPLNLIEPIEDCILNFKYWLTDPGEDALDFSAESHSILFHTCEILAGQLFPDRIFSTSNKLGSWHNNRGGQLALDWMRQRGRNGFYNWDSNYDYEKVILALSYLTSLVKINAIYELAAVLLDKMIFTLAVNSFKGTFGTSHGYTHASMIKSAQLEATSGITRFLWGMGIFNHCILGTVGLACSDYEFPAFFTEIAYDLPQEMWSTECQFTSSQASEVPITEENIINKVTYKTPDYMISSAQDFHHGKPGKHEHIWQATLGSDAVVFTTHPGCMSESLSHQPGFWLGNAVLPRVAQWKDTLIAIYNFSEQDWLGFTHAYFPIYAFDEHVFANGWAFARKDNAYLAITSARGFELNKRGPDGYRELRSYGHQNIWICQMGRKANHGSFKDFQDKVSRLPMGFQDLTVQMTNLSGENLAFGWQESLTINGMVKSISTDKHIENPYCTAELPATQMDIRFGEYLLRLMFD
jgi:hypothetical protein